MPTPSTTVNNFVVLMVVVAALLAVGIACYALNIDTGLVYAAF